MPRYFLLSIFVAILALVYVGLRYLDGVYIEVYGDPDLPEGFETDPDRVGR